MTPEERFERIEAALQRLAEGQVAQQEFSERLAEGHMELEAAQLNQQKVHVRLEQVVADLGGRITNLTILVDRLVARNMER